MKLGAIRVSVELLRSLLEFPDDVVIYGVSRTQRDCEQGGVTIYVACNEDSNSLPARSEFEPAYLTTAFEMKDHKAWWKHDGSGDS